MVSIIIQRINSRMVYPEPGDNCNLINMLHIGSRVLDPNPVKKMNSITAGSSAAVWEHRGKLNKYTQHHFVT